MTDLNAIAKAASEGVAKNAGIAPQLAFAPILWALQDAHGRAEPPAIHIECETVAEGVKGTTGLNAVRVEANDDGSWTVVTDHWPSRRSVELADFRRMVEEKLAIASRADFGDAPFGMGPEEAVFYHNTRANLLTWVLDMLPQGAGT